ncbi:hypothetical protein DPMN_081778 [Dreissena polymorpha]|uniref:Uncharacterized protein n=1 Tax=Dreissena polymorpha TaxID=45954 RepID=A0A9D3Y5P0_DREPO|nr:hypothetical protein DPMN_081778 [Dreissena polymorpha]
MSSKYVVTSDNVVLCRQRTLSPVTTLYYVVRVRCDQWQRCAMSSEYVVTSDNVVLCRQRTETFEQFLCYKSKSFRHESLSEFHPVVEEELKTKA